MNSQQKKLLADFFKQFTLNASFSFDDVVVHKETFFLPTSLGKTLMQKTEVMHSGIFLGAIVKGKFMPSMYMLEKELSQCENILTVSDKATWLFVCGRDILGKGVVKTQGSFSRNTTTIVQDESGTILGYGYTTMPHDAILLKKNREQTVLKNLFDRGYLLRREMKKRR